jgi:hypothetical protein
VAEEEQKLGPNATYQPEDENRKEPVKVGDIQFTPGKAVNVEDRLGKEGAKNLLKKLAGNPAFKVDGGTDWKQQAETKAKAEQQDAEDAEEARKASEEQANQPPPGWKGPEEATLESDSAARRPNIGKGRKDD